jgi:GMP synthase-like glutamine amidotransferase
MRAHILQHASFESPGSILTSLQDRGVEVTCTRLYAGEPVPISVDRELLIVMGGPMSVNDEAEYPWLAGEKAVIADAVAKNRSVLGICLGAQLVASALGCRVYPNAVPEIGWFPIVPTSPGVALGLPAPETLVFHWHGETFDLPDGATLLASSPGCVNQAFAVGPRVIGLQCHLEVTPDDVRSMIDYGRHELAPGRYVQSAREILDAPAGHYEAANRVVDGLVARFLAVSPL